MSRTPIKFSLHTEVWLFTEKTLSQPAISYVELCLQLVKITCSPHLKDRTDIFEIAFIKCGTSSSCLIGWIDDITILAVVVYDFRDETTSHAGMAEYPSFGPLLYKVPSNNSSFEIVEGWRRHSGEHMVGLLVTPDQTREKNPSSFTELCK
ncbi:hypothetical protein BC629DRAFT_1440130 [Irpex lacteus]|nr:hypothetical protein BC629DRAFT_1440130 [Irpex lacteus]